MYDAIIVGARCAGSPTAMLLARKGYRVLLVDKATFPCDVVNGYYIHQSAVARLQRWGVLDKLRTCNCPPLRTLTFDFGDFALTGSPSPAGDVVEGYAAQPALTCWYYTHWSGVPAEGVELYLRARRLLIACRTNDGLTQVLVTWPHQEFHEVRANIERHYFESLALAPALAERVRSGRREERFVGTADMANFFRQPYGPGWALVGDAGYHKDPYLAQGITDSFRDAELLAEAIDAGFSGRQLLAEALAAYEQQRNAAVMPMYELTLQLANLTAPPAPALQKLFAALRGNQTETNRFFGTLAGTVPIPEFFAPENVQRIMSAR